MRRAVVFAVLILCGCAKGQEQQSSAQPTQFEIGRRTFFDFGPPFDFYELFLIHPSSTGTSVERITLTPPGDACVQSAKVEVATGALGESVAELLGNTNPCTIPEKELHRELKRCKKCLVFSGAVVAMQAQCGTQTRIIRADILDRDMFDPAAHTPEHTSWTMQLLGRIDQAFGSGVMDRPAFTIPGEEKNKDDQIQDSEVLRDVSSGKYDLLFQGAPDKPSDLYRPAQIAPPVSTIRLVSSTPLQPEAFVPPEYPPILKVAHVSGTVSFTVDVGEGGTAMNFTAESGQPVLRGDVGQILRGVTGQIVTSWKFPKYAVGQKIHAAIEFATNCPARKH